MNEWTRKSYVNFVDALWEATLDQAKRSSATREAETAFKAAVEAWHEAAVPEITDNIGSGFYTKKPLDLSRFNP